MPTQLIHGPYPVPSVQVGDLVWCAYRGAVVVVTGFAGPRRWPQGRVEGRRGRPSLVVTEELARAIRLESPMALCSGFGVSISQVRSWRQALPPAVQAGG